MASLISGFSGKANLVAVRYQALREHSRLLAWSCALQELQAGSPVHVPGWTGEEGQGGGGMSSWSIQNTPALGGPGRHLLTESLRQH